MTLNNIRKLADGTPTTIDKTTYRCSNCDFPTTPQRGFQPDECSKCEAPISAADQVTQTPGVLCPRCDSAVPADDENQSWGFDTPMFVCPRCKQNPILAVQHGSEIKPAMEIISTDSLSVRPAQATQLQSGVYVSRASVSDVPVIQILNAEAQTYDSTFNAYSITSDDTNILVVFTGEHAIGYLTWTRELCDDDVTRSVIQQIFLLEDYWRQGIGDALVEYAFNELSTQGEAVWVKSPNVHMMTVLDRLGLVSVDKDAEEVVFDDRAGATGNSIRGLRKYYQQKIEE